MLTFPFSRKVREIQRRMGRILKRKFHRVLEHLIENYDLIYILVYATAAVTFGPIGVRDINFGREELKKILAGKKKR